MKRPEYRKRLGRLRREVMGKALLYLATGEAAAGGAAVEALKRYSPDIEEGRIRRQCAAALFDWFHDHPAFDAAARKAWIERLEQWAEKDMAALGEPGSPFYTTMTRRLAAFTCTALARDRSSFLP